MLGVEEEVFASWLELKGSELVDGLRTLDSDADLARLPGGARNRISCLCQALFYVLRNFHAPRAVAQSTAGGGSDSLGVGRVRASPTRTYNHHSVFGCERS